MSNPTELQKQDQPAAIQAKDVVEYIPFGAEDRVKLSVEVIQNFIAVPTKEGELPDRRDCMRFLMLCRSRRLDPFTGDAYLIGFKKRDALKAEWSLITSQSAFMKRAEVHPTFDGLQSGVIVESEDGEIVEREGDFTFASDKLLGGWATVHFNNRKFPMRKKVKLLTYQKPFGVWVNDPAGMICKVAEVHALRDSFPTMLGGMMLREEYTDIESTVVSEVKRPEFAKGLPAPDLTSRNAMPAPVRGIKPAGASAPSQTPPQGGNAAPAASSAQPEGTKAPTATTQTPSKAHGGRATLVEEPEPAKTADSGAQPPETSPPEDHAAEAAAGLAPETPPSEPGDFVPDPKDSEAVNNIKFLSWQAGVTEAQVMAWAKSSDAKLAKPDQKTFAELSTQKLVTLGKGMQADLEGFKKRILEVNK